MLRNLRRWGVFPFSGTNDPPFADVRSAPNPFVLQYPGVPTGYWLSARSNTSNSIRSSSFSTCSESQRLVLSHVTSKRLENSSAATRQRKQVAINAASPPSSRGSPARRQHAFNSAIVFNIRTFLLTWPVSRSRHPRARCPRSWCGRGVISDPAKEASYR